LFFFSLYIVIQRRNVPVMQRHECQLWYNGVTLLQWCNVAIGVDDDDDEYNNDNNNINRGKKRRVNT
jgi:hypothetical protein